MISTYYWLTKPGIIWQRYYRGSGFFLAGGGLEFGKLALTLLGLAFIIGSACVFNNYADRNMDVLMERTRNRGFVAGTVSKSAGLTYAVALLAIGIFLLFYFVNNWALGVALLGFFVYVFIYTPAKPRTVHATLLGSIAGATPPVVGYCAVTGHLDLGALLLFLVLIFWQMPHFYSIAIFRLDDYSKAGIPVLSVKNGIKSTKRQILIYILLFIAATSSLTVFGFTGYIYLIVINVVGLVWLWMGIKGFSATDNAFWANKMFRFSLIVLVIFSIMASINFVV